MFQKLAMMTLLRSRRPLLVVDDSDRSGCFTLACRCCSFFKSASKLCFRSWRWWHRSGIDLKRFAVIMSSRGGRALRLFAEGSLPADDWWYCCCCGVDSEAVHSVQSIFCVPGLIPGINSNQRRTPFFEIKAMNFQQGWGSWLYPFTW